jgi:hypothetical protein
MVKWLAFGDFNKEVILPDIIGIFKIEEI